MRRGADRVVHIGHAIAHAQGLQPVRQRPETIGRRRQRRRIQAQRLHRGQHRAQVAAVVPARQRRLRAVVHRAFAAVDHLAAHVPAVLAVEPAHLAVGQLQGGQLRIGGVEQGDARPRMGDQLELVGDVARLAAVPVQMLGKQVQHQRQLRPCAAAGHVAGLVTGQFDRPILRRRHRRQHFQQRHADIADQAGAMAAGAQQVRQQRGGGALALGAGDADAAGHHAVRASVFGEPQRGAADEARAARRGSLRLGPVRTDPGRLDHHIERGQALGAGLGLDMQRRIVQRGDLRGLLSRTEHRQRQRTSRFPVPDSRFPATHGRIRRTALAPPTPQRDALRLKLRNSHARVPTGRPGCGAARPVPAAAPRAGRRGRAAAGSRG
ncbi:hypothetical protein NB713_002750 [Xanthomonas sacchari]|nr:hypothetical protein [Xanthomonas sacchari]